MYDPKILDSFQTMLDFFNGDEDALNRWLNRKNRAFDHEKPIDIIEAGGIERILEMIWRLESGSFS